MNQKNKTTFRLGELFCGPGGLACGAMKSVSDDGLYSVKHAWANDYDEDTCKTYIKNICPADPETVHCGDVRELDVDALGEIDAFCYGFPCNSFSNVGEHKGLANEKFGQLYWYGIEVLRKYRPKWFVAENVSGIRSAGSGDFQVILNDMKEAGYKLNVNLYKAEQYGIPQTRHRVIIVGIREDIDIEYRVPDPKQYSECDVTSGTALSGIPSDAPNNEVRKLTKMLWKDFHIYFRARMYGRQKNALERIFLCILKLIQRQKSVRYIENSTHQSLLTLLQHPAEVELLCITGPIENLRIERGLEYRHSPMIMNL